MCRPCSRHQRTHPLPGGAGTQEGGPVASPGEPLQGVEDDRVAAWLGAVDLRLVCPQEPLSLWWPGVRVLDCAFSPRSRSRSRLTCMQQLGQPRATQAARGPSNAPRGVPPCYRETLGLSVNGLPRLAVPRSLCAGNATPQQRAKRRALEGDEAEGRGPWSLRGLLTFTPVPLCVVSGRSTQDCPSFPPGPMELGGEGGTWLWPQERKRLSAQESSCSCLYRGLKQNGGPCQAQPLGLWLPSSRTVRDGPLLWEPPLGSSAVAAQSSRAGASSGSRGALPLLAGSPSAAGSQVVWSGASSPWASI